MPTQGTQVTIEELRSLNLEQIANECTHEIYYEIESALARIKDSNAAKLLSAICSMHLKPENTKNPFSPKFIFQDVRGILAHEFPPESLSTLVAFCNEVKVPEIKARIADVCWVTKTGTVEHAYIAIEAYLDSAKKLMSDNYSWPDAADRLERALRLSCMFRRDTKRPDLFKLTSEFITSEINSHKCDNPPFYALRLLELAYDCGVETTEWILNAATLIAQSRYDMNDIRTAIRAWECALKCATTDRNTTKQQEVWRHIANCYIKDANIQDGGLLATSSLLKAIDSLSKIPNTRQERLELYEEMRDYQLESLHQLNRFYTPEQDISEIVHQAKSKVQGKDFNDMLFRLAVHVCRPTKIENLRTQATTQMQSTMAWMFGATHIDHEGMTVATVPPGMGIEDDQSGQIIWSIMMQNINIDHQLAVQGQIKPAVYEITSKYPILERNIAPIFSNHPFIPYGHEHFFIKGIIYGFEGDFLTACHLLIPQIENSLRYLVRSQGEEPTTRHPDGSQERNGLKALLNNEIIIDLLGQDITGNLQAILIDKIYGDLRNQMSHGYVPSGHFFNHTSVFLWWLILHILMFPYSNQWQKTYGSSGEANKN